jgi:hypothetical protein
MTNKKGKDNSKSEGKSDGNGNSNDNVDKVILTRVHPEGAS